MTTKEDLSEWKIAPTKKMYGYGFGYIIVNYLLLYGLSNMDYFYRVAIGISGELILLSMIIFAIWNMVNDPLLGYITDKPLKWTKKWGLRAPWIVLMTVPMFIFFILIWTVPTGVDDIAKFIYMVLIVCLFDMFFSIYNDHLYGGYTNQFPSKFERRKSFMIMTVMLFITLIVMSVIQSRIVGEGETDPTKYILNSIVMVALLIVFTIPTIKFGIGESEEMKSMFIEKYESADKASFFEVLKTALKTKNFRISLLGYTVQVTATTLWNAAQIYFFVDVYGGSLSQQQIPLLLSIIAAVASIPFWSNFTRKGNFKRTYWIAFLLHGISYLPFLVMLALPIGSTLFITLHMVYDEVALKLGKRSDATFVGIRNFFFRVAFLVQALVFFIVLTIVNYDPTPLAIQTETAKAGIIVMGAVIPSILFIVMSQVFRKSYTLVGKEKDEMVKNLKEAGLY
jgi:GPH family glycoside/pentoside/hexuronide:cation symporter